MTRRRPVDDVVEYHGGIQLSPNGLRALEKATGRSLDDLLADDGDKVARVQVLAFAELWRRARAAGEAPDPGDIWERAGDVDIDFAPVAAPGPLLAGSSTTSPPSAATGE
jgi:hypothetical protein